jgi:hypothetical protein
VVTSSTETPRAPRGVGRPIVKRSSAGHAQPQRVCSHYRVLLSAAGAGKMGAAVIQDLKTILIVVSATFAALFVHHALDQAQATAAGIGYSAPATTAEDRLPVFE